MNKLDLRIIKGKFTDNELYIVKSNNPKKVIDLYQANYFDIYKLYYHNFLIGYAVIFLGYHGMLNDNVSLEDIGYFASPNLKEALVTYLIDYIIKRQSIYYKNGIIYYNAQNFSTDLNDILSKTTLIEESIKDERSTSSR